MIRVFVLEPDAWRYRGLCSALRDSGKIDILGEPDFAKILTLSSPQPSLGTDVVVLAHRLIVEYGLYLVPHLRDLFPTCSVLAYGDVESLDLTAQLLAAGARGYFHLASPPGYLATAVRLVSAGKVWGPREAVALMAELAAQGKLPQHDTREFLDAEGLELLRLLNEGLTNKEIAQRLGLAEATIKARLTRLYKRFGVRTRLQLLSRAIRQGLVRQDQDVALHDLKS